MRPSILLALTLAAGCAGLSSPAFAQYSRGDVPSWQRDEPPPPRPYYPPPGYRPPPDYGYRPPRDPYYRPPSYGYGYPPRGRYSNVCITARGNCSTGRPLPASSPCSCFIPGFGTKRGAVAAY